MAKQVKPESTYNASEIEVLEGLDPVRRRPGMYIGGTEGPAGLHHLVKEILDNSIDEAMNGHADTVTVTLHKDKMTVSVEDNGRGIPVDMHPKLKKPALEVILTTLHSGGKFSEKSYSSAGGLHGVGSSVVNALSVRLEAVVSRDGYVWSQEFCRGKPTGKLKKGEKSKAHGTKITFTPDDQIFSHREFSAERIERMAQEKAFLNRGITIYFIDEGAGEKNEAKKKFYYEDGLHSYLTVTLERLKLEAVANELFVLERTNGIKIEAAFCWTEAPQEKVISYVNGIFTAQGGTHDDGFKGGIVKAVRNYLSVHDLVPKGVKITSEDIREGLVGILSVTVPGAVAQLQFQGQTKDKLNNPEIEAPVEALVRTFENTLNSKPQLAQAIVERVVLASKARAAARSASEGISRKIGISHRLNLPGKLADCSSTNPNKCEVFIVEGDSAGGSAKQGRDRNFQAILPLRGKILNSIAAGEAKLKENKELLDLVSALGCGFGESIRLERLRYGKVIILTDADADGMHIASLLMAFFFRYMRPLITGGHLYLGLSPLYRIRYGQGKNEEEHWVYSDVEKEKLLAKKKTSAKPHITRFKGLGEMNADALWETSLDPETRTLVKVGFDDEAAVIALFESLLGRDPAERYKLIQENAHRLELDI